MLLGVAAAMNTRNRIGRVALGGFIAALFALGTWMHVIPKPALALLLILAVLLATVARRWAPPRRSAVALALSAVFVIAVFALRETARREVAAAPPERVVRRQDAGTFSAIQLSQPLRRPVDLLLSSQAANPLCWSVLSITTDEQASSFVMTRGTVALLAPNACGAPREQSVEWETPQIQSVARLRALYANDCWVRAWLQFGRAPEIRDDVVSDLRYSGPDRPNFTTMPIGPRPGGACPANLTDWRPPRADLLRE